MVDSQHTNFIRESLLPEGYVREYDHAHPVTVTIDRVWFDGGWKHGDQGQVILLNDADYKALKTAGQVSDYAADAGE